MLEKMTNDEIAQLLVELKASGYDVRQNLKGFILRQEAEKLGMVDCFMTTDISKPILDIADWATNNYEKRGVARYKKKTVNGDIDKEYRSVCSGILKVIQRYYGREGFCQRQRGKIHDREMSEE